MQSVVVKRSIVIAGHKTSVSLEDAFWQGLKEIGTSQKMTLSRLVADIDARRPHGNLSSAIRLFVLDQLRVHKAKTSTERVGVGMEMPQIIHDGHQSKHLNGQTGEQQ